MHRGQIWLYNPNPTVGDEMGKTRPAIIVNNDTIGALRLKVIVAVTGWSDDYIDVPWLVKLTPNNRNGLSKISAVRFRSGPLLKKD